MLLATYQVTNIAVIALKSQESELHCALGNIIRLEQPYDTQFVQDVAEYEEDKPENSVPEKEIAKLKLQNTGNVVKPRQISRTAEIHNAFTGPKATIYKPRRLRPCKGIGRPAFLTPVTVTPPAFAPSHAARPSAAHKHDVVYDSCGSLPIITGTEPESGYRTFISSRSLAPTTNFT
ncbi:hypothetical protein Trydic_g9114 [Trypoxylus dichotomus]